MGRILRGEIRWADPDPVRGREQAGLRPVLVLSHDVFKARSGTAIGMAITSQPQRAGFPLTVELESSALPNRSWVKVSQIRTLSVERIDDFAKSRQTRRHSKKLQMQGARILRNEAYIEVRCNDER